MNQITGARTSAGFTDKEGQYLAFVATYTLVNGRPPAESDMQRFSARRRLRSTRWCSPWKRPD